MHDNLQALLTNTMNVKKKLMKFIIIITIIIILKLTILGFLLDHFGVHRIKENNDTDRNNSNEIVNVDYR